MLSFILTLMLFKTHIISFPEGTQNEKNVKAALFLYNEQVHNHGLSSCENDKKAPESSSYDSSAVF